MPDPNTQRQRYQASKHASPPPFRPPISPLGCRATYKRDTVHSREGEGEKEREGEAATEVLGVDAESEGCKREENLMLRMRRLYKIESRKNEERGKKCRYQE